MNKCQHGKNIYKFCMFEHCQSKEPAGCEDCIKKYHNHIGQVPFLTQQDIKNIVKKFQIQANYRPKSRPLQQCIFNFFTHIKTVISSNLDIVCKNFINQIGYPYLHKNGTLNCYKRLKNKQYRKVTQRQLRQLFQYYKAAKSDEIISEEKRIYSEGVSKMESTLQNLQKNVKQMFQHFSIMTSLSKSTLSGYDKAFYFKITQIFKQIKKYPDISFPKSPFNQEDIQQKSKKEMISNQKIIQKRKLQRDVSLDKHLKVQNKLKLELQQKFSTASTKEGQLVKGKIASPIKQKQKNFQEKNKKQQLQLQKQPLKNAKRATKYSFEHKGQQNSPKPSNLQSNDSNYSQKEQQILERKKKLLQLMNSTKPLKKQQTPGSKQKLADSRNLDKITPIRDKSYLNKLQIGNSLKEALSPERFLINKDFWTPSNTEKQKSEKQGDDSFDPNKWVRQDSYSHSRRERQECFSNKRFKTAYDPYDDQDSVVQQKNNARNQTAMSSQTQTEPLFNAKIDIPFEDTRQQQQFQIKQQSVHKCIVIPEVNITKQMIDDENECRSPLLIKRKQIKDFSAFIKLAESKIIEDQTPAQTLNNKIENEEEKSFVKINKILQQSSARQSNDVKQEAKNQLALKVLKENQSVQINDNQQKSLALLLHSLKLPAPSAIVELQKALAYSSNNLSAAEYLTYLYLEAQRPQDCLKLCNDVLKTISSSQTNQLALKLNINKSASLNHLGRYSQCITFLERCLRYRHNDILYKNLADAYYSIGILEKAIYNYEHAILQNSSNTEAHYNLSVCHYQQQNYHNASIYIDKALKHQPTNEIYKQMQKYVEQKIFSNQI